MIRIYVSSVIIFISFLASVQQVYADNNTRTLKRLGTDFGEVLKYADAKMWAEATEKVDALNSSVAYDILQWLKLRAGITDLSE